MTWPVRVVFAFGYVLNIKLLLNFRRYECDNNGCYNHFRYHIRAIVYKGIGQWSPAFPGVSAKEKPSGNDSKEVSA